jgi:hypothetical protein
MSLENNPDELFGKPLSVYPMTNPTPQAPPEPWPADPFAIIMDTCGNPPNVEQACAAAKRAMVETCERARAAGRRPDSSAVLAAALERLMAEGVTTLGDCVDHLSRLASDRLLVGEAEPAAAEKLASNDIKPRPFWDSQTIQDVYDWFDAGMTGYLAARQGEQPPADETTTTED